MKKENFISNVSKTIKSFFLKNEENDKNNFNEIEAIHNEFLKERKIRFGDEHLVKYDFNKDSDYQIRCLKSDLLFNEFKFYIHKDF